MQFELPLETRSRTRSGSEIVRAVRLSGRVLTYRLRRSSRRTLALYVDNAGIRAAAPRWVAVTEIERFMREKERWILAKLAESATAKAPLFEWCNGAELRILGVDHRLSLDPAVDELTSATGSLLIPLRFSPPQLLRSEVLDWVKARALVQFEFWARSMSPRIDVPMPAVRLSNAATRWGSCSIRPDGLGCARGGGSPDAP